MQETKWIVCCKSFTFNPVLVNKIDPRRGVMKEQTQSEEMNADKVKKLVL